ncbi:unnamed protein product [Caenorhabditis bovis]|uniref:DUF6570 domain-containing protein n=1 Tax=Caenorhabditis bovis TaxID=2654633 RepID=A0A8S1EB46_9PELO|nr:unnamed protein product [Caenorhabditis bovis]
MGSRPYSGLKNVRHDFKLTPILRTLCFAITKNDKEALDELMKLDELPVMMRIKFLSQHGTRDDSHHHQAVVLEKFAARRKAFLAAMEDQETEVCDVCEQLTVRTSIVSKKLDKYKNVLLNMPIQDDQKYRVCRMCSRELSKNQLPAAAICNSMKMDDAPEELKNLNLIKLMLVQKVRAIQSIVHLRDIGNRKTAMKATKGVLIMVPVFAEETVDHVAKVLPSSSRLQLQVLTQWQSIHLVSLPRVIKALKWLKHNNLHYRDISINEAFKFEIGRDVFFEKPEATQKDADALIDVEGRDDDHHLLTQAHIENVPMAEVNPPDALPGRTL